MLSTIAMDLSDSYLQAGETGTAPNRKESPSSDRVLPNPKAKLLGQVREVLRIKHYSLRTEEAYVGWIKRFIFFHGKRHPRKMGAAEVQAFLSDLAVRQKVAASTQNQALNALVFLYNEVLHLELTALANSFAPNDPGAYRWC